MLASVGQASSVGGLSVPPGWAAPAAAASGAVPTTLTGAGWTAAAPHTAPVATMPAAMPSVASAGRGGFGLGAPRYGVKPTVMPKPAVL
ncbi:PE/PPE C-terminal domain-containing protein [Mycobacterium sp.]|uniref:PE/PPE C-terminal domain-containing protein n=1 Tax=Mycobacterium sp. TaxID=1785 RepID=UPI0031D37F98